MSRRERERERERERRVQLRVPSSKNLGALSHNNNNKKRLTCSTPQLLACPLPLTSPVSHFTISLRLSETDHTVIDNEFSSSAVVGV